jgi:hypothetical protein
VPLRPEGGENSPLHPRVRLAALSEFFKKKLKKIKFEKDVPIWKILKNGYLPPDQRAEDVWPDTSRPSNGREVRGPYSAEGHNARWVGGRFPS